MSGITDAQLVQLLGTLGGAVPAAIGGGIMAPQNGLGAAAMAGWDGLVGGVGGGMAGGVGGGALGALGGAGVGKLLGLDDRELQEFIAAGGGLGAGVGGLIGSGLGGGAGARAGYERSQRKANNSNQQEKEGSDMSYMNKHAHAVNALQTLASNNVSPDAYVQAAMQSNDASMRKTAAAIVEYSREVRRNENAFAVGAVEKLAEYNISPQQFVQAAVNSNDRNMRKIASTIVNLDEDLRAEQTKQASVGALARRGLGVGQGSSGNAAMNAAAAAAAAPAAGEGMSRAALMGLGGAGLVGAGGLGAGAAYLGGDADTTGNKVRRFANQHLGTDFDTESRLQQLLGRMG